MKNPINSAKQLFAYHPDNKAQYGTKWRYPMSSHLRLRRNVLKNKVQDASGRKIHNPGRQAFPVL